MSFGEYTDLYREYEILFDTETMLRAAQTTYRKLREKENKQEKPIAF